ncbi:MAG: hypothetical protein NY202_05100 [Mollicutes bacterium UO1]
MGNPKFLTIKNVEIEKVVEEGNVLNIAEHHEGDEILDLEAEIRRNNQNPQTKYFVFNGSDLGEISE